MILDRVTLCDFRSYGGIHEIELKPRVKYGSERPIVLFGGLNGAGKTSLLLAIKLVLYGRHALGIGTSQAEYTKFMRGCIHHAPDAAVQANRCRVELTFTYGKLGQRTTYRVNRSWRDDGGRLQESLEIWEDGELKNSLTPLEGQGFLNELVPLGVSELFFFDGEKIAELAEDDSGAHLGDAIRRLLGLNLIERLRSDLRVFMRRSETKKNAADGTSDIEALEAEYGQLRSALRVGRTALNDAAQNLEYLHAEKDRCEARLTEHGGSWGLSRQAQTARMSEISTEIDLLERRLREELGGLYPLSLAHDLLAEVAMELTQGTNAGANREFNQAMRDLAADIEKKLGLDPKAKKIVDETVSATLRPEPDDGADTLLDVTPREAGQIEAVVTQVLPQSQSSILSIMAQINARSEELDKITLQIERAPDEESLADDFALLAGINNNITEVGADLAVKMHELQAGYQKAIGLARRLRNKYRATTEQRELDQPLELAVQARQLLKQFGDINARQKVEQLNREFAEAFRRLARKGDIVAGARIDPIKFTVTLVDRDGTTVDKARLSAGEKQIYAIAMLDALGRTSGRRLPVIIDTPLGRLDSHHRANLVEEYFPYASHQVVLLSTDTEVDESFYRTLSPHISHAYELRYNESERATNLHRGYFWRSSMKEAS